MRSSLRFLLAVSAFSLVASCGDSQTTGEETPAAPASTDTETTTDDATAPGAEAGDISSQDLARHIATLASDAFEGRAPGTPGGEKTRAYIASEYERIGLEPIGDSFEQPVPIVESTLQPDSSSFSVSINGEARDLEYRTDVVYWTKRAEENVEFADSELVFVGYGVVAPEYDWNDYDGVDVEGKTVVILVNDPGFATQDPDLFNGNAMTYYGRWTYKYEEAARQGAAAAMIIHDTAPAAYGWNVVEGSWSGPQVDLQRDDNGASRVAAEGWFSNDIARTLFDATGLDMDAQMQAAMSRDFQAVPMPGVTASAVLNNKIVRSEDANVVGVLKGAQRPDEYVLYMGHWDHLGTNPDTEGDDKIYNGAVDNATGIAAIIEIAEKFATNETAPDRSIMLVAVTAEESGLLGSAYFGEYPPVPLKQIVAGVNIDAILPTPPSKDMIVVGYGASELEDILKDVAGGYNRYLTPDPEAEKGYFYRSDHISLAKKGVPMLYADGGADLVDGGTDAGEAYGADYRENRYHAPSDEYDADWPMDGMLDTVEILYEVGATIAYSDDWPNWYEGNEFRALRDAQLAGE
ncbi:MAG: M28 family metallopeptidase [Pseudomonadota bacterium]